MNNSRIRATIALLVAGFALGFSSLGAASHDEPKQALESTIEELIDVLHANEETLSFEAKRDQIVAILNKDFSFDIIIQRALGRNWNKLDDAQKEQVTLLITDLVLKAYIKELKDGPRPKVRYSKPKTLSSSKIEIPSKVELNGTEVNLSYRLANLKDRGWQVYDVLVEGVSMVSNYRKQFDEHFQKKTAVDLIELLKEKLTDSKS